MTGGFQLRPRESRKNSCAADNGRLWDVDVFKNEVYLGTDSGIKVYSLAGVLNRTLAPGVPAHRLACVAAPPPIQIHITSISCDANQERLKLIWNSEPAALYTVETTEHLESNPADTVWDNVTTGIASGGGTTTHTVAAPSSGSYVRIRKQ